MSFQDGISDMLTRIRNACMASQSEVSMPLSKMKSSIAKVLKEEGYLSGFTETETEEGKILKLSIKFHDRKPVIEGLKRISKPSCRIYCGYSDIPKVRNGLGTVILSTNKGIISGRKAAAMKVGGEILCYVW